MTKIITRIIFVFVATAFCLLLGAFIGGRVITPPGSIGWDALGNMLGGAFLGGLAGFLGAIVIVFKVPSGKLTRWNLIATLGLTLEVIFLLAGKYFDWW